MDKIEKIRQKIKELRELIDDHNYYLDNSEQALGYGLALDDIGQFLDTLSEEPDKSLEEAAIDFADNARKQLFTKDYAISSIADYDHGCIDGFKAGAEWQKEQILNDAVEGYADKDHIVTEGPFYYIRSRNLDLPNGLKEGDRVKLIIVKDDGQD